MKTFLSTSNHAGREVGIYSRPDWIKADRALAEAQRVLAESEPAAVGEHGDLGPFALYLGCAHRTCDSFDSECWDDAGSLLAESLAAFIALN